MNDAMRNAIDDYAANMANHASSNASCLSNTAAPRSLGVREIAQNNTGAMREILSCDLLILDDLGAEFATAYSQSVLYQVINDRMTESRPTIISTNLDLPALSKTYHERILSRLIGSYTMYGFVGRDIRQQKLARHREETKV